MNRLFLLSLLSLVLVCRGAAQSFEFKPVKTFSSRILQAHPYNNELYLVITDSTGLHLMRTGMDGNNQKILLDSLVSNWSLFKGRSWNRGNIVRFFEYNSKLYVLGNDISNGKGLSIYQLDGNKVSHKRSFTYSSHDRVEFSTDSMVMFLRNVGESFDEDVLISIDLKTWTIRQLKGFSEGYYGIYNDSLLYGWTDLNFTDGRTGTKGTIVKFKASTDTTKPKGIWPSGLFWFDDHFYFYGVDTNSYQRVVYRDSAGQFTPYIRKKTLPWGSHIGNTNEAAIMLTYEPFYQQLVRLKKNGDIRAHATQRQLRGYENFGPKDVIFGRDSLFSYYNGVLDSVYTLPDLTYAKEIIWHIDRFFIMTHNDNRPNEYGRIYSLTPGSRKPDLIMDSMTHDLADTIFSKTRTTHMFTHKKQLYRFDSTTLYLWTDKPVGIEKGRINDATSRLFPNPASRYVNINLPEDGEYQLIVTDMSGRQVWHNSIRGGNYQLSTMEWKPGVYTLTIVQNKQIQVYRLMKK